MLSTFLLTLFNTLFNTLSKLAVLTLKYIYIYIYIIIIIIIVHLKRAKSKAPLPIDIQPKIFCAAYYVRIKLNIIQRKKRNKELIIYRRHEGYVFALCAFVCRQDKS